MSLDPYEADKIGRAGRKVTKQEQRDIAKITEEMKHLDRDARKPGYSKERAAIRKAELKKMLSKYGVLR